MSMYYLIKKDTETYRNLLRLNEMRKSIFEDLKKLCSDIGANGFICSGYAFYGDVIAFTFDSPPPGIQWVEKRRGYMPRKNWVAGKVIYERLSKIEVIPIEVFNQAIGFKNVWHSGKYFTAGFAHKEGEFWISVSIDSKFEANEDMIEIYPTEFIKKFRSEG